MKIVVDWSECVCFHFSGRNDRAVVHWETVKQKPLVPTSWRHNRAHRRSTNNKNWPRSGRVNNYYNIGVRVVIELYDNFPPVHGSVLMKEEESRWKTSNKNTRKMHHKGCYRWEGKEDKLLDENRSQFQDCHSLSEKTTTIKQPKTKLFS